MRSRERCAIARHAIRVYSRQIVALVRTAPTNSGEHSCICCYCCPPHCNRYVNELAHLEMELIKLQEWARMQGLKVAVIFEGPDAAGKGGATMRIAESLNPRVCRIVALVTPTQPQL